MGGGGSNRDAVSEREALQRLARHVEVLENGFIYTDTTVDLTDSAVQNRCVYIVYTNIFLFLNFKPQ